MEILFLLIVFVLLGGAAYRWGYDSTEAVNSVEWERRQPSYCC